MSDARKSCSFEGSLDFGYTADGVNPTTYWSATNGNTFSSALS